MTELKPVIEPLTDFYEIASFLVVGEEAFTSNILQHQEHARVAQDRYQKLAD